MKETRKSEEIQLLLEEHLGTAYRFAFHFLSDHHAAQDVAQEALLRAWKNRERLKKNTSGKAWLLRITANICRDRVRRMNHKVGRAISLEQGIPQCSRTPDDDAVSNEQFEQIRAAIGSMAEDYRTVIYLRSVENLHVDEIAQITGEQVGTVKVRLSRARRQLRNVLIQNGVMEGDKK